MDLIESESDSSSSGEEGDISPSRRRILMGTSREELLQLMNRDLEGIRKP
jgi:hypothetical protein